MNKSCNECKTVFAATLMFSAKFLIMILAEYKPKFYLKLKASVWNGFIRISHPLVK